MNLHVPQSIQANMELKYLPAVSKQIISPSYNEPIITPAQDNLLGLFKITDDNVFFNQRDMMNLLMDVEGFDGKLPDPQINDQPNRILWTGKQLISMILPPISMTKGSVVIEKGIIKKGQLNKSTSNGIVHIIFSDYGHIINQRYLNNLQKIVIRYMIRSGYSIGMSDIMIHPDIRKGNEAAIVKGKHDIAEITKKVHLNTFEDISQNISEVFENKIEAISARTTQAVEDNTVKLIESNNRVKYMISAGTKGNMLNFTSMLCLVNQQKIDNKRICLGFSNRSLPHFSKYDNGMESKGYIASNYRDGLTPQEFFFHAMAGREGLIDTAVKTARSGYLQRKLIKATEDLKVQHDYTVRNSNGDVVQFLYGDDGFNAIQLEKNLTFDHIFLATKEELENFVYLNKDENWSAYLTQSVIDSLKKDKKTVEMRFKAYNSYVTERIDMLHSVYKRYLTVGDGLHPLALYFPIHMGRLIKSAMKIYNLDKTNKSDVNPLYAIESLDALIKRCLCHGKKNQLLELFILDNLSVPRIIKDLRLTKVAFDHLINAIEARFRKSLVQGGEMVGPLAAQSIGEVSTQLTLRSVDWDTGIIISCDGVIQTPLIGEFIDNYYKKIMENPETASKVELLENDQIYIPMDDGHEWLAHSTDEFGVGMWTKLEAITRHPVINEDGSDTILEVELDDGRVVKATKAKSFLVFNKDEMKLIATNGSDIKVGDMIPVISNFEINIEKHPIKEFINMRDHFSPLEYIYGTEVHNALRIMRDAEAIGDNKWYNRSKNVDFVIPYGRSDAFRDAYVNGHNTHSVEILEGFIYNKTHGRGNLTQIPDKIILDEEFGYFCGAYLADGMANEYRIIIAKHDADFIEPIKVLMARWNIGYRYVRDIKKVATETNAEWASTNHIFQSVMFAKFMGKLFGFTSEDKIVPAWVLQSPVSFQKGLISGYFSGDGSVSIDGSITASSISCEMLNMFALILKKFEINSSIHKTKQDRERFANCKEFIYNIRIYRKYNRIFHQNFKLSIAEKQRRLEEYLDKDLEAKIKYDIIHDIVTVPIKSIKEIRPMEIDYDGVKKRWVYDVTVEGTKHFSSVNSVVLNDTFHSAGSAAASSVNQGVPRLDELLNKQIPKKTQLQIFLTDEYNQTVEKADEIRYNIELVKMSDILLSDAIYAEPSNNIDDVLEEDREIMKIYEVFSELDPKYKQIANNPWIIRLEFNRREMINKKITMEDVNLIIQHHIPHANIVFADDNAGKMVFRMRLDFESNVNNADDDINLLIKEIEKIKDITIKGIDGIQNVYCSKNVNRIIKENNIYKTVTEHYLITNGSNLMEILTKPYVDATRTTTIDVNEAYSVLGVEAARWLLENQFHEVFNSQSKNVCPRHIGLVCDLMTCKGKIMAANRNGINHSDIGPFAKISFEETIRQLKEAGLFGKYDHMTGVSSNIMFGQIPACGTGDSEILLDEDVIAAYVKDHPNVLEAIDDTAETPDDVEGAFGTNTYCDENRDIEFNFNAIEGDVLDLEDLPNVRAGF